MILVVGICRFQGWDYDGRIGDGSYLSVEYEIESVEFLTGENTCQSVKLALFGISSTFNQTTCEDSYRYMDFCPVPPRTMRFVERSRLDRGGETGNSSRICSDSHGM